MNKLPLERRCGTTEYHQDLFRSQLLRVDDTFGVPSSLPIIIPVIIHVVYKNETENISNAQIVSQIDVLNEDYRRTNRDAVNTLPEFVSVAADCEINFTLAQVTRTPTTVQQFTVDNKVKFTSTGGHDVINSTKYLNIWVCDIATYIGYAQFPGGDPLTDGVIIDYRAFGRTGTASNPFQLGRTATHEIGHWLNLKHIWGDGGCGIDDGVADTPDAETSNVGCPLTATSCGGLNMVQNYMDYTNDACMNIFTQGQKQRMLALFAPDGVRSSFVTTPPIQLPSVTAGYDPNKITLKIIKR